MTAETDAPTWFVWTAGGIMVFLCIVALIWFAGFLLREHHSTDGHVLRAMVQTLALCAAALLGCLLLTVVTIGSASALGNPIYTIAALTVVMVLALIAAPVKVTGTVALGAMLGYLLARPLILLMQTWPRRQGPV